LGLLVLVAGVGIAPHAEAAPIFTVPPGLAPGTQYRLVFVTFDTTDATSTLISTYNTFVTTEANDSATLAGLGVTWTAIVSTAAVNAIDNIGTPSGAVYNLGGLEVATSTSAMFSPPLDKRINVDQFGNTVANNTVIWSGTHSTTGDEEATRGLGTSTPELGQVNTGAGWLTNAQAPNNTGLHPIYAISSVLTAPAPEPGSIGLMGLGMAGLLLAARRRRAS
jgi:hypothetical protein